MDCPVTGLKCSVNLCRQWVWETEENITCPECAGTGQNEAGFLYTECFECDGSGIVQVRHGKCLVLESQQGG